MMRGEVNERIYGRREDTESINRLATPHSSSQPGAEDQRVDHLVASHGPIERMT